MTSAAILRVAREAPGTVVGPCVALLLLLMAWGVQASVYTQSADALWMLSTGVAVLVGAAALGWLRPQRVGFTAPQAMLLLGAIGMVLGLVLDARATRLDAIAEICGQAQKDLAAMLQLHWTLLPWMHAGMWAGGFAAIPLLRAVRPTCRRQYCARAVQNVACSAWMTLGMSLGVLLSEYLVAQFGERSASSMLGGMFAGMVWGMVASVALYRLYFRVTISLPHAST